MWLICTPVTFCQLKKVAYFKYAHNGATIPKPMWRNNFHPQNYEKEKQMPAAICRLLK